MNKPIPIFPLGEMVLFPEVSTEFYIFEERYLQMIEHCLDSQGIFCFTTLIGDWQDTYDGSPEMHSHGCVCSIQEYQKHEDGRYSILVKALYRCLIKEIPSEQLYRQAIVERLEYEDDITASAEDNALVRNFIKRVLDKQMKDTTEETLNNIIDEMELGKFLSILSFRSNLTIEQKLSLLKVDSLRQLFIELSNNTE